jgi:hypothetical protein
MSDFFGVEISLREFEQEFDVSESLAIEAYLEKKTMERLDILAHKNFVEAIDKLDMPYVPVQSYEYEVSAFFDDVL